MKYRLLHILLFAVMVAGGLVTRAQETTQLALSMHSEYYDLYGEDATFNIMIGTNVDGVLEMDCGRGREIYEVGPVTADSYYGVMGTVITCHTTAEGMVRIYLPEGMTIDYLNLSGCGLTTLDIVHPENIEMLNIEHNSLTALDLSGAVNAAALYLGDNPFARATPLVVGPNKPNLIILDMGIIDHVDPAFTLTDYPSLITFDAMSSPWLTECDPSQCPGLMKLSIDASNVTSLDLSHNPALTILNISDTGISEIDLSHNPELTQLYCDHSSGTWHPDVKFSSLDLSHNPKLRYLFCNSNNLTDIDLSHNPELQDLYIRNNYLTSIDLSGNPDLYNVMISRNFFNFNTLPVNPGTWGEYEYAPRPLQVPKSCKVGAPIDLKAQVVRDDSETTAVLYRVSVENPDDVSAVDPRKYTFEDGVLTVNAILTDSLYCEFYNSVFPYANLRTSQFMVKSDADFGKPSLAATLTAPNFTATSTVRLYVGISDATEARPKTFYVDMGNGTKQPFIATTSTTPSIANVDCEKGAYGDIRIYVEDTDDLTALAFYDEYLSSIDVSPSLQLGELTLCNTDLYSIDLSRNRRLEKLVLRGNHFGGGLTLAGSNGYFSKNVLGYIDLRDNELTDLVLSPVDAMKYLDLSHNKLTNINLTDGEFIKVLNLSYNEFEFLRLSYQSACTDLDISHNNIDELIMPETNNIERFNLVDNRFTLVNMPDRSVLDEDHYVYAPQQPIQIPAEGFKCDLSDQNLTISGNATQYTWMYSDGTALVEGEDYTIDRGVAVFDNSVVGRQVYCMITNAAYPAFAGADALRTTVMTVVTPPTNVVGSFTTTAAGRGVRLSIAGTQANDILYIDWGDGEVEQYPMTTTYTVYSVDTKADKTVRILSTTPESNLTVFSITGQQMKDVNLDGMPSLMALTLSGGGLTSFDLELPGIRELDLSGNKLAKFDTDRYPTVDYLNLDNNSIREFELKGCGNIGTLSMNNNGLEKITLPGGTPLWALYLTGNKLTEVDLAPVTHLYQVALSGNRLNEIDLDNHAELRVAFLDNNRFTFATLPRPREQWVLYVYGNQAPIEIEEIDGKVDLSSQAFVGETPTQYTWYMGYPEWDNEMGTFMGDELEAGYDYTVDNGVTTFLQPCEGTMCVMTNEIFPSAWMYTNMIDATGGIGAVSVDGAMSVKTRGMTVDVTAPEGTDVSIYTAAGVKVYGAHVGNSGLAVDMPAHGIYLVRVGETTVKIGL